ncbi:tetratricopeptide repeat protein [Brachyspira intermedia]|uniref:tetratricopeptide repeat protein n=1 Tax=Brachyspira intermedia TaxID=84377 RepID=UPI003003BF73
MTEELKTKIQKLIEEKHFEEAIKLCDEAIEKDDKDEDAYFQKASCYFRLEDYNTTIENYNKVTEINPNDIGVYLVVGNIMGILKQHREAIEYANKIIKLDGKNEKAYLLKAMSNFNLKLYKKSIKYCDKIIGLNPNNESGYFYKAKSYFELKDYILAIENYNKVIELNPNDEEAYFNIGFCKIILGQYKQAILCLNKTIELDNENKGAYLFRAYCRIHLQFYMGAIDDLNHLLYTGDIEELGYFLMAQCNFYFKNYKQSIYYLDKSIELNPLLQECYYNRGICNYLLKQYVYAIEDFNKTIELNAKNINAYFFRGIVKIHLENENTIEDFRSFFKINEDNNIYIITILQLFEEYEDIDKLFKFIVDIKNNELWENEPITNLISRFDESKNFDDELRKNIKYLILYEYFLLKILTFDTEEEENNNIEISHYTSLDILTLLLNPKEEKTNKKENTKESGNIRINNITTANDPKEGKILERILNKNNIDIKIENDEKALTLQTSYSRNKDSLTMFRLYGKKENKEATGVCLVLDNKYFNNSYTSPYSYELKLKIENNKIEMNEKINKEKFQENKRNLYWVLYYNEKENQLIYNKEKSKYASNIIDLNDLNNDDYKAELKEDDKKEGMIKYAFVKIFYYTKEIKKQIEDPKNNENYKNIKNQLYSYLFENIKYIIKHEAFFEEQELRMLVTNDYKSDEILIDNDNKKLYIDYIKLFDEKSNYIKEIIIGSKVENNEAVAEYIRKILHSKNTEMNKLDDIKVSISEAPLR